MEPTQRKRPRSGCRPALRLASRNGAEAPNTVRSVSAANDQSVSRSGWPGSPSKRTTVAPDEQPGDQVVPHHPTGGGEPCEPVVRGQVLVEREHLQVLERDPAVAVHDGLRQARRARAEEHVERVIERDRLERQRSGRRSGEEIGPGDAIGDALGEVRDRHHLADARDLGADGGHLVDAADRLAPVPIAVDGEQDHGIELGQPVDHASRAELRSTAGPDRPDRGGGEEGDQGLGDVRCVGRDPIAASDTEATQAGRAPRHRVEQLAARERHGRRASGCGRRPRRHQGGRRRACSACSA